MKEMVKAEDLDNAKLGATPLALFLSASLFIDYYFLGNLHTNSLWAVSGFCALLILITSTHLFKKIDSFFHYGFFLVAYHILMGFLVVFMVDYDSYYLFVWVLLICVSEYYYRWPGLVVSATLMAVFVLTGLYYQTGEFTFQDFWDIAPITTFISLVSVAVVNIAIGDRKRRDEIVNSITDIRYQHQRLIVLINSFNDAVLATDINGVVTLYNAAAQKLVGRPSESLNGVYLNDLLGLKDQRNRSVDLLNSLTEVDVYKQLNRLTMSVGENDQVVLDVDINKITISAFNARQFGYLFILRDVTKQSSLDDEKDLFLSEVSHELRTPITIAEGSLSMADLVAKEEAYDINKIKASIGKAYDSIAILAELVNDLSTLSRADRDDSAMDIETFPAEDVINSLYEAYKDDARDKDLVFTADISPSLPMITTSKLYFQEILQNIIGNAVKYTLEGSVKISMQVAEDETLCIKVKDTGAGIAKSDQDLVYDRFWRSEDPMTRKTGGTGLGLYISKKLAERIGAEIIIDSEVGKGTEFTILIPVVAVKHTDSKNLVKNEVEHILE